MGYELHIVRKADWKNTGRPSNISLEEWVAYVKTDPELLLVGSSISENDSGNQVSPGFTEWLNHPDGDFPESRPWLMYGSGAISSKYPDAPLVHKMVRIAKALHGKVQGDDGKIYDESYLEPEPVSRKPWWKLW